MKTTADRETNVDNAGALPLRREGVVAYQALADELREAISRGDFAGGKRLPTEAELSMRYGVSRQTVRRAHQDLVAEGLIYRVRGRGTYANPVSGGSKYLRSVGSIEDLLALALDTSMEVIRPLERRSDINAASRLGLDSDQVMSILILRRHDDVPFCVTQMFVPLEVGRRVLAAGTLPPQGGIGSRTLLSLVEEATQDRIVRAQQSITSSRLPPEFGGLIGCEAGDPVLVIDRLYFDSAGRVVELSIAYFNPDRYAYRLELRRSH